MTNERYRQVLFLQGIASRPRDRADLMRDFGISKTTVSRWLKDLRSLGASIVSIRGSDNRSVYVVQNADAVQALCSRWIDLEHQQDSILSDISARCSEVSAV